MMRYRPGLLMSTFTNTWSWTQTQTDRYETTKTNWEWSMTKHLLTVNACVIRTFFFMQSKHTGQWIWSTKSLLFIITIIIIITIHTFLSRHKVVTLEAVAACRFSCFVPRTHTHNTFDDCWFPVLLNLVCGTVCRQTYDLTTRDTIQCIQAATQNNIV